jgi:hypothetical protein
MLYTPLRNPSGYEQSGADAPQAFAIAQARLSASPPTTRAVALATFPRAIGLGVTIARLRALLAIRVTALSPRSHDAQLCALRRLRACKQGKNRYHREVA